MDPSSAPLADYFWIAGIDSISYNDAASAIPHVQDRSTNGAPVSSPSLDERIDEASENGETEPILGSAPRARAQHSRSNSWQRLSKLSSDARDSIQSLESLQSPGSNRSSMTIRAVPADASKENKLNGANGHNWVEKRRSMLGDFDFDTALVKFASERESFLSDLSFSAGTVMQHRPPMTAKAERLRHEDVDGTNGSGRRSPFQKVGGTLRRKLSFKDMNSARRQPAVSRTTSVRTSKRLSNYNSVIPQPEPLNADPDMHPLKRRFEPVLLDRYPPKSASDEVKRRGRFPDYVPMFAFPNDINVVSADERPRSTWHGFAMTGDDNAKIYGVTVIIWVPLSPDSAATMEQKCEEWRQNHMTNEERELAASLGERLALERATLSQLLAQLPAVPSGSMDRENLEEQISATEEKIGLMTDMLRPVRHGAASKIDGLTDGETGLWAPRAYGVLGRDGAMTSFWKEWLRAIVVPMMDGTISCVPPSSPKVGRWQPLERYVVNLCTEALCPITSKMQVELTIRELRLFARKSAVNELPDSRNTDLYALFRALSIPNIVALFEFMLSESRIILLSSHTAMLHLISKAMISLLYPLEWQSILIPVLPARLISALDAPCPYIVGIERRYENVELPEDDYVLVDLDHDFIESTSAPVQLPRQQRRKLASLLHMGAQHHTRFGVPTGPAPHAIESFPYDAFSSENSAIFTQNAPASALAKYVSENSTSFEEVDASFSPRPSIFNAFLQSKVDHTRSDRPSTSKSTKVSPPPSLSPVSSTFSSVPAVPANQMARNDSGLALTSSLREKRSGHFDAMSRRSSSFNAERQQMRRPNAPFSGHVASQSTSSAIADDKSIYGYAPSTYATSTIAASTIMPNMLLQPVYDTETTVWVEGHCMQWQKRDLASACSICDDNADSDGIHKCRSCNVVAHARCLGQVSLVCPTAFHPERIRAAFVRCFASLFYTHRKYLKSPNKEQKSAGRLYGFDTEGFVRSLPSEQAEYMTTLKQTQAFDSFISQRELTHPSSPSVRLFDEIILAKRNRGFSRASFFSKSNTSFLDDTSEHLWRSAAVPSPSGTFKGDYRSVVSRIPSKLDPSLMREPMFVQGVPRVDKGHEVRRRKAVPSMLGKS